MLETSCKNCIFATYQENTQIGCELNLLDRYTEIDECFDDEKEFYVLRNTLCGSKRNSTWKYAKNTFDDQVDQLKVENRPRIHVFIVGSPYIKDITCTLKDIRRQKYHIELITVLNVKNVSPLKIIKELKNNEYDPNNDHKWELKNIQEGESQNVNDLIHFSAKKHAIPYYVVFEAGKGISSDFLNNIGQIIESKTPFGCIKPKSGMHELVVPLQVHLHWRYLGHTDNVVEQMEKYECESGTKTVLTI